MTNLTAGSSEFILEKYAFVIIRINEVILMITHSPPILLYRRPIYHSYYVFCFGALINLAHKNVFSSLQDLS